MPSILSIVKITTFLVVLYSLDVSGVSHPKVPKASTEIQPLNSVKSSSYGQVRKQRFALDSPEASYLRAVIAQAKWELSQLNVAERSLDMPPQSSIQYRAPPNSVGQDGFRRFGLFRRQRTYGTFDTAAQVQQTSQTQQTDNNNNDDQTVFDVDPGHIFKTYIIPQILLQRPRMEDIEMNSVLPGKVYTTGSPHQAQCKFFFSGQDVVQKDQPKEFVLCNVMAYQEVINPRNFPTQGLTCERLVKEGRYTKRVQYYPRIK